MGTPSPALTLGLLSTFWITFNAHRLAVGPFLGASAIMADFGITAAAAGLLVAAYSPPYGLLQVPAGLLVDRASPRRTLRWALLLLLLSGLLFALAPTLEWAVLARIAVGVSSAPVWLTLLKVAASLSGTRYPRWVGVLATAGSLAGIVCLSGLPVLLALLSWRQVALLLLLPVVLTLLLTFVIPLPERAGQEREPVADLLSALGPQLRSARFWWLALPATVWCGAYFAILSWLPRFARDVLRVSPEATGLLPGLFALGLLVGGVLLGSLHTRYPDAGPGLFFGGGLLFTLALGLLPLLQHLGWSALLYLLAPSLGLLFGAFFTWMALLGRLVPLSQLATVTSVINGLTFLTAFVDPWLMGVILDLVDRPTVPDPTYTPTAYAAAFLALTASMALGLIGGAVLGRGGVALRSAPLEAR